MAFLWAIGWGEKNALLLFSRRKGNGIRGKDIHASGGIHGKR